MSAAAPTRFPAFAALAEQQPFAVRLLERAITSGKVAHAYIFKGHPLISLPVFVAFCQTLLCPRQGCQTCHVCQAIARETYPDVRIFRVPADSKSGIIKLAQVQELIQKTTLPPVQAPYQIFAIEQAEKMNQEASNALLKTLEEPSAATKLVLLAASGEMLLPTIRSRAQMIPLRLALEHAAPEGGMIALEALRQAYDPLRRFELAERLCQQSYQPLLLQFQLLQRQFWQYHCQRLSDGLAYPGPEVFQGLELFDRLLGELNNYANIKLAVELFLADLARLPAWVLPD